jgi:hypothetical protein
MVAEVPAVHTSIADLSFPRVPEGAVRLESVFVSVVRTNITCKNEDVWLASRGC